MLTTAMTTFIVLIVLAGLYILLTYNRFVMLKNRVKEAWSDIEVQMKRRYDLIPNLVETVKGYASHEKNTLDAVIKARNAAMQSTGNIADKAQSENALSGTLKSLFALSESYPKLKANENFLELQRELTDTENKIQSSRRFYNSNVLAVNTKLELFPSNIIGGAFGFTKQDFFKLDDTEQDAKKNVKVSF
ncbi:LemA family protein [Candidatus Endomicrobiellum trichonymphae]|uniref:Conserved membrane protein LemA n=1 Tax=Endomicrobium trichonymphae TaxID=1408204 RepID=B1GZ27_ENDTX|nr:LemA family protein [Candidatus Endomicrobium trichonymphae]BAG13509.1 conserved membrane protein LemA [Candidatus Endomicrobium trichonymphae]